MNLHQQYPLLSTAKFSGLDNEEWDFDGNEIKKRLDDANI